LSPWMSERKETPEARGHCDLEAVLGADLSPA
jgi:hypothetical protein